VQVSRIERDSEGVTAVLATGAGEERVAASHLLIATGRRANLDALDLDKAGIERDEKGAIRLDRRLRTTNRRVFAVGDAAGGPQFTHAANYQAGIVLRNVLFRFPAKVDYRALPAVTYTEPELAQVGLTEAAASGRFGSDLCILRWPLHENDRGQVERCTHGLIKVLTRRNGRILGATILAPEAGELIQPWVLALGCGLKIGAFANMIAPYPTLGEIGKRVAGKYYLPKLMNERTKSIVKWLRWLG
jgi:pyruvate/2-oxoglutarate dehydrogenase complex dihydrolipoamide dehydrogenase (E3) component